jgi:hypothetical protein
MLAQDSLDKSGSRGFSVGSSDVNHAVGALRVTQQFNRSSGGFKSWSDLVFRNPLH